MLKCFLFLKQKGWFAFPKAYWVCAGLAVVVALPGLALGFFVDDYFHLGTLEGGQTFAGPFDLFCFAPGDPAAIRPFIVRGPLPWWTLPEFKARFCRPLSSALIALDYALFGRAALGYHLHSILWYVLLIVVWGAILRRVLPEPAAVLALVIFALDEVHWFPAVWIANRNALVAAAPALLGLYAHLRWREEGWRPGLPLSVLGYAVGLAGGETALGVLAYLGAYELFGGPGNWRRRAVGLLPAVLVGLVYIGLYTSFGFGSYGSGSYLDPLAGPVAYLRNAPVRILALLGALLLGFTADMWAIDPSLHMLQAAVGVVAAALFVWLVKGVWNDIRPREGRALRWLIPGMLLALFPVAATFPSNRLLLAASLGGNVLVAVVLARWWPRRKPWRARPALNSVGYFLIVLNLVIPIVQWPAQSYVLQRFARKATRVYMDAEIPPKLTERDRVVLVVAADPLSCLYPPVIRQFESGEPIFTASWLVLSAAPKDHRITRTGPNRIEIEVLGGSMLETEFEGLVRTPRAPFAPGDQVDLDDVMITILETNETGPIRVAFEFDRSIDDPTLHFIQWRDKGLRKAKMPAVGEALEIPRSNGLMSW